MGIGIGIKKIQTVYSPRQSRGLDFITMVDKKDEYGNPKSPDKCLLIPTPNRAN